VVTTDPSSVKRILLRLFANHRLAAVGSKNTRYLFLELNQERKRIKDTLKLDTLCKRRFRDMVFTYATEAA